MNPLSCAHLTPPICPPGEPAMPVQCSSSVGNTQALTCPMGIVRQLEALFTCVTFSLVASRGDQWAGTSKWCMFSWCFCFAVTLVGLLVESVGLQHRMPISWKNFHITFAMYAALFTLSASVIYPFTNIKAQQYCWKQDYHIAATFFSCLACMAYSVEVTMIHTTPGKVTGYMATMPGMLKVVETFIACIIFVFISNPIVYDRHEALKWCLAVYCICFIFSLVVFVLCVRECTGWLPCASNKILIGCTLLAVLLYSTATILWPLYNFDSRPRYCQGHNFCTRDKSLAITVLTVINLVVYLADLVYSVSSSFKPRCLHCLGERTGTGLWGLAPATC
ncbi:myeloid-associated differentiation marker homolog [Alligator sinensis]|uniref:Myeloid-associated differentiation marker homolog n=1 Tax=Alligator sinensis TaxID=38654 RepID=A0A1U7SB81_ALLSI|nr:myeloid-associated differentiation marker homolog [Alligator sinensis]